MLLYSVNRTLTPAMLVRPHELSIRGMVSHGDKMEELLGLIRVYEGIMGKFEAVRVRPTHQKVPTLYHLSVRDPRLAGISLVRALALISIHQRPNTFLLVCASRMPTR